MAYNIYNKPQRWHLANNLIPFRADDSNVTLLDKFKYHLMLGLNQNSSIPPTSAVQIGFGFYTKLVISTLPVAYNVGDSILIYNATSNLTNTYNILEVGGNYIVIDLPFVASNDVFDIYNVIDYKFTPDLDNEMKVQLQDVLSDRVHNKFKDITPYFFSPETHLRYSTIFGYESEYVFTFYDNFFSTGSNVGFIGTYNLSDVQFNIGDTINVIQDPYEWDYTDIVTDGTNAVLVGAVLPNHQVGQFINVLGTALNGSFEVQAVGALGPNTVTLNLPYQSSYNVSNGQTFGQPNPQYDGVTTITDITVNGADIEIHTDKPFGISTGAIGGTIKVYPKPLLNIDINEVEIRNAYRGFLPRKEFENSYFMNEEFQMNITSGNLSTTSFVKPLPNAELTQIDKDANLYLLSHFNEDNLPYNSLAIHFLLIDSTTPIPTLIHQGYYPLPAITSLDELDIHLQSNPAKFIGNPLYVNTFGTLDQAAIDSTTAVNVKLTNVIPEPTTQSVTYYYGVQCSRYEDKWNLLFEDKMGSFIPFSFHFRKRRSIGKKENNIYKKLGKFDTTNNTFNHQQLDGGRENYNTEIIEEIELNTGYINKQMSILLEDLFTSNIVLLEKDPNDITQIFRVNVVTNSLKVIDTRDELSNYKIAIRFAITETRR